MSSSRNLPHSVSVETKHVQSRLARLGALMAGIIWGISIVQLVVASAHLQELQRANYWFAVLSGLWWASLWLSCKHLTLNPAQLRWVEAICIGGAVTALAIVSRLAPTEDFTHMSGLILDNDLALSVKLATSQQESSRTVVLAMALALVARAALVPTSPRRSLVLTAGVGLPLVGIWLVPFALLDVPNTPMAYLAKGNVTTGVAFIASIWWVITTTVCTVISREVHGLRVEILAARKMGQYVLEEKLGEGGMGEVYRASHSRLRRSTAIKLLPSARSSLEAVARFENEVQLTSELTHPNTIRIYDYGRTEDGTFYYAMEHLRGITLEQLVEVNGPQPASRVIRILEQAAGALQEAHTRGLVHRDVKPANIMLTRQGNDPDTVKVLDFGLVRTTDSTATSGNNGLTQEGSLLGTPLYMAPEVISANGKAGSVSDIYSLGAVGYFLLTGSHVFSGTNMVEMCAHHLHSSPEPMAERLGRSIPSELDAIVMSCLEKSPAKRPQSAAVLVQQISTCTTRNQWTTLLAEQWWRDHKVEIEASSKPDGSETVNALGQALTIASS